MILIPAVAGQLSRTFLPALGERVFLCLQEAHKDEHGHE